MVPAAAGKLPKSSSHTTLYTTPINIMLPVVLQSKLPLLAGQPVAALRAPNLKDNNPSLM
jgi:hypothetical protein